MYAYAQIYDKNGNFRKNIETSKKIEWKKKKEKNIKKEKIPNVILKMKKYSLLDNIIHRMVFIENWTV